MIHPEQRLIRIEDRCSCGGTMQVTVDRVRRETVWVHEVAGDRQSLTRQWATEEEASKAADAAGDFPVPDPHMAWVFGIHEALGLT